MLHIPSALTLPMLFLALLMGCQATPTADPAPLPGAGGAAAPLVVTDMDGASHDLSALSAGDQRVVLVFWQTWCMSCHEEAPLIVAAARNHSDFLSFIGVVPGPDDVVDDAEVRAVATEDGLFYPHVRDRDVALSERFGVDGTPTIIVLGEGGRVLYQGHTPPESWEALRP